MAKITLTVTIDREVYKKLKEIWALRQKEALERNAQISFSRIVNEILAKAIDELEKSY
jgi:predicted CopG family antitoxin